MEDIFNIKKSLFKYNAEVIKVYDGDTITCNIDLGFGVFLKKQSIRLYGINTPEVRGNEKAEGIKSRDYLRELIFNKVIRLETIKSSKKGKYGRWLGIIYLNDVNINKKLVDEKYAKIVIY